MYEIHTLSSSKLSETISKKNYSDTGSLPEIKNVHCGNICNRKTTGKKVMHTIIRVQLSIVWICSGLIVSTTLSSLKPHYRAAKDIGQKY